MAAESLILDPTSDDATNVQVDIVDNASFFLLEHSYPPPERDVMLAPTADTEGDPLVQQRYRNREVTIHLRVKASSAANLETALAKLTQKMAKFNREGGTLKRTLGSGDVILFDIIGAELDLLHDRRLVHSFRTEVTIRLTCKPFGRAPEVAIATDHTDTTIGCLVFTETSFKGDVPATARMVVDEDSSHDQYWLTWGVESRYYNAASTAALYQQAESLTALSGSSVVTGPAGASGGASNNVMRSAALSAEYDYAILSTQATGGGAHLSHIGDFQVYARVQTPTSNGGAVNMNLSWSVGDGRRVTNNATTTFPVASYDGTWRLVDLGQVHIPKVTAGTQRWEGRIVVGSTRSGDKIDVDILYLVPITEGSGRVQGVPQTAVVGSITDADGFDQAAGALNGKTLIVGGTWATSGDATDLATTGASTVTRTTTADAGAGRTAVAGSTSLTNVNVQTDVKVSAGLNGLEVGVYGRWIDATHWALGWVDWSNYPSYGFVNPTVTIQNGAAVYSVQGFAYDVLPGTTYTVRMMIDASGRYYLWVYTPGSDPGDPRVQGQHDVLATGGGVASGKPGIWDLNLSGSACTRTYYGFLAYAPTPDAAVMSGRSIEIRSDRVVRQDSGGTLWVPPGSYEGDYMTLPAAGQEARTVRVIVKASRNTPTSMSDPAIDAISAKLNYVPRYLNVPAP